jgi:hypothetical protein
MFAHTRRDSAHHLDVTEHAALDRGWTEILRDGIDLGANERG